MTPPLISSHKWSWQQAAVEPPLGVQAGDVITHVAGTLLVTRAGVVVATRILGPTTSIQAIVDTDETITSAIFLKDNPMPGQNVSCTKVQENQNTGSVTFSFSSGNNTELPNWEAAADAAASVDANPEFAEKILIGKAYRASADGANKTTQVGASVSVNLEADVPVVYTPPA